VVSEALQAASEEKSAVSYGTSTWHQFTVLLKRNLTVARRDVTLYWLQLGLHSGYGKNDPCGRSPLLTVALLY
jgi:hypothetical protein